MSNPLATPESEMQRMLSEAWDLVERMLRPAHSRRVPVWALPVIVTVLILLLIADTFSGLPAVSSAADALVPVDMELGFVTPVVLSAIASLILIVIGLAADLSRREFTGFTRIVLTAAALMPLGVVLTLAAIYMTQLMSLAAGDGVGADSIVKLAVPVIAATVGHATILAMSKFLSDALEHYAQKRLAPRLQKLFATQLRPAAEDFVSIYTEHQIARARLTQFGSTAGVDALTMSPQAPAYFVVAQKLLMPGDTVQILIEIRTHLHPAAVAPTNVRDAVPAPSVPPTEPQPISVNDRDPIDLPRRNGTVATAMVMMGSMFLFTVASPISADANRLPVRTGGQGHRMMAGIPAQHTPARMRAPVTGPSAPRLQHSPTPEQIAQARTQLPRGKTWKYTANLAHTNALSRSGHRYVANRDLAKAMDHDEVLRRRIQNKFGRDSHERLRRNRHPRGAQWDHSESRMDYLHLMSKTDHAKVTRSQAQRGVPGGQGKFKQQRAQRVEARRAMSRGPRR